MSKFGSPSSYCLDVSKSLLGRAWELADCDQEAVNMIIRSHDLSEILARILVTKGHNKDSIDQFLNPTLKSLMPDPFNLADMETAIERLIKSIDCNEKICIFGDYDVDGATSVAVLTRFFRSIGVDVSSYIPDRVQEGYGPNSQALRNLHQNGVSLVITVDCGIAAFEPLSYAADSGLDVIVIDHHKAEMSLPEAVAVINPNRLDDVSGQGHLAAVGVVFLFLVALNRALRESGWYLRAHINEPDLLELLDLVALGTVCDVVPLIGLNRAYVLKGMKIMQNSKNKGLIALSEITKIKKNFSSFSLSHQIGPCVNAGGRIGESALGSRLLSSEDNEEASILALRLFEYNMKRREIEALVLNAAIEQAEGQIHSRRKLIFVSGSDWHPGVIGIVASRLSEKYDLPACVVANDGGVGKGSARSVPGIDLGAIIISARDKGIITKGGGHSMAAGFTVNQDCIDKFSEYMDQQIELQLTKGGIYVPYKVYAVISVGGVNKALMNEIKDLEPFGAGNEEPRIAVASANIIRSEIVGNNHVKCVLGSKSGGQLNAIAFNNADSDLGYSLVNHHNRPIHLVGAIRENFWQNRSSIQFVIEDGAWA